MTVSQLRIVALAVGVLVLPVLAIADVWNVLAVDLMGDSRGGSAPDAAQLSYRYDKQQDVLWFRMALYGLPREDHFNVTVAIDSGAPGAEKVHWWGANKDFTFDRLVTASVTRANRGYRGTIGLANSAGIKAATVNNVLQTDANIRVEGDAVLFGIKRADLTGVMQMSLTASVGFDQQVHDDVPNGRFMTLDLAAPRPTRGIREIDTSRNNFRLPADYKTLADNQPPSIVKKGDGPQPVVLIPGVYSGEDVFDAFMARNPQYQFFVVIPPGLNGTPARPLPPETTSYGELTWTRRLVRDVLDLIAKEKLTKPVIIAHGFPGSLVAEDLASRHADVIGGVIQLAAMPPQYSPSPKDPTGKTPATPDERADVVNQYWASKWFKYVTPETWETNNYRTAMFANDAARAEHVRTQIETAPLPVKIRYLTEFMASDHSDLIAKINVPMLVLRPGFNAQLFADPAYGSYKTTFQDRWDRFSKNPNLQLQTIADARALLFDDQPKLTDDAINAFVARLGGR